MAAVNLAAAGVIKSTSVGQVSIRRNGAEITLNNGYTFRNGLDGKVAILKSGAEVTGPITKRELLQLWQDIANTGAHAV